MFPKGLKKIPSEKLSQIPELIEPWFIFSLVWSIGATGDYTSRVSFSHWLRMKMMIEQVRRGRDLARSWGAGPTAGHPHTLGRGSRGCSLGPNQVKLRFPEEGLVFDYRLDDAGISSAEEEEDDEEEGKQVAMGLPRKEGGRVEPYVPPW